MSQPHETIHAPPELQLNASPAADIADLIETNPPRARLVLFNSLGLEKAVETFSYLNPRVQLDILAQLPSNKVAEILNALSPDDRTGLLEALPKDFVSQLLKFLSPIERAVTIKLLGYPENSVGRLMTPDYLAIKLDWTVRQILDFIRAKGRYSETINIIYAIDDAGILMDDFRIRDFLFASLDTKASELADYQFIALNVDENEEKAVNVFRRYDRSALPVIDKRGILLGIVTFDDIIQVAVDEGTEDIQKLGGVSALDEPYMDTPFFQLIRKRIGWLTVLFLGEMLTASAMGYFSDELSKAVVLALFIPLIISAGGNAGSQASTLIIRALALGELGLSDWWKIMHREILSGIVLGGSLGVIGFFRVTLWSSFSDMYGAHWLLIAWTILFSVTGVVLWGTFSGSMMPLLLKKLGLDPAVSSGPFVATLVDVTGIIIYFTIALFILQGTLI